MFLNDLVFLNLGKIC
jgi:hypothetical protein